MSQKVVIIGAGSLAFSSRLIADILSYPELADTHLGLVDIDPARLAWGEKIARRIIREGGYDQAEVTATSERREVLEGADAVIISVLVGGYDAIEKEIDIPATYGVDQSIGDTLTPGGIMRCLRTLPVMLEMGRDIMELCPRAAVLNYTNPMGMLSWGMVDAFPEMSYVGLCHSVQGTTEEWAKRLGVDMADIHFECAGINHQAWLTRFEKDGEDLLPRIREKALDPYIWTGDTTRMEYVKHFGYPVTESSGHVSEYNPWFRKNDTTRERYCDQTKNRWNGHGFIKELYNRPDWEEQMRRQAEGDEPINLQRSMEYGSRIIKSLTTGEDTIIYGTVRNSGCIENLPADAMVEVACHVSANGIKPLRYGKLPPHLAAINQTQLNVQRLAKDAVFQRDLELAFQAMCLDPLTGMSCTLDEIRAMTADLIEAHREYLPYFAGGSLARQPVLYDRKSTQGEAHIDPALGQV